MSVFGDLTSQGRLHQTDDTAEEKDLRPSTQRTAGVRSAVDQASAWALREDKMEIISEEERSWWVGLQTVRSSVR